MNETTTTTPEVWIGCLASYNEGRLIGEWVEIPTDANDLRDEITRILAGTGGEEWYAGDIQGVPSYLRTDYPQVEQLTEYAAALEQAVANGLDADIYETVCDDNSTTVDPDEIMVYGDGEVYNDADIALAVCDGFGSLGDMLGTEIPETVERYFDWDAYGRDLRIGDGFQIINGYAVCYTG